MSGEVCAALGLTEGQPMAPGKLLAVSEEHGGDAGFLIGCLVKHALQGDGSLCLLALRDAFPHHRAVAKKLGHDLQAAVDSGRAVLVEPFEQDFASIDMSVEDNLKRVFLRVKRALDSLPGQKTLIVDDLGDLLTLGAPLAMVLAFLQYCRTLRRAGAAMVVCCGVCEEDEDRRALANLLAHSADKRVTVAALRTGFSASVTGTMEVVEPQDNSVLAKTKMFHYKATDRQVKVFAPGTAGITC